MAKKPDLSDIFAVTTAMPQSEPVAEPAGRGKRGAPERRPLTVALTPQEISALDGMVAEMGVTNRHQLLQMAVRYFVNAYQAGKIEIRTETRQVKKPVV